MKLRWRDVSGRHRAGVLAFTAVALVCGSHVFADSSLEVRVRRLDGASYDGQLVSISAQGLVVRVQGAERAAGLEQIERLEFSPAEQTERAAAWLEWTDGTVLPVAAWRWDASNSIGQPLGALGELERELSFDPTTIRAILQQELSVSELRSWEAMVMEQRTSDAAVLRRAEGVLDSVDVVVERSSDTSCEVLLDGERVAAPRERIVGLIFAPTERNAPVQETPAPRFLARGPQRLKIAATQISLSPEAAVEFESLVGLRLRVPPAALEELDFSPGNALYLSDLEPQSREWRPYFGEEGQVSDIESRFGAPRFDRGFDGGPLRLFVAAGDPPRVFAKGIALRSGATLGYELPPGYNGLTALAGIDPESPAQADLRLVIEGDGRPLASHDFRSGQAAQPLQVDIHNVRQLRLVVEYGANLDIGDRLYLVDARLVR